MVDCRDFLYIRTVNEIRTGKNIVIWENDDEVLLVSVKI